MAGIRWLCLLIMLSEHTGGGGCRGQASEVGGPPPKRSLTVPSAVLHVWTACTCRLCHPDVLAMKAADRGDRCDGPDGVHGSVERSILVEPKVRTCSVIVAGVVRQQAAKVVFPEHHDMVEAVASN